MELGQGYIEGVSCMSKEGKNMEGDRETVFFTRFCSTD